MTLQFPQVPERYFGHLPCQMGCRVHSMRQVPHKKHFTAHQQGEFPIKCVVSLHLLMHCMNKPSLN